MLVLFQTLELEKHWNLIPVTLSKGVQKSLISYKSCISTIKLFLLCLSAAESHDDQMTAVKNSQLCKKQLQIYLA